MLTTVRAPPMSATAFREVYCRPVTSSASLAAIHTVGRHTVCRHPGRGSRPVGEPMLRPSRTPAAAIARIRSTGPGEMRLPVGTRHLSVVERLLEDLLVDAHLPRDLPKRAPRLVRPLDDLRRAVVADVGVERGGRRE